MQFNYEENKNRTWFKILSPKKKDLDNARRKWSLPQGVKKGEWFTSRSSMGTWLVTDPKKFVLKTNSVFVTELSDEQPILELPGIIWVRKVRLVREATNLDVKKFGLHRAFKQDI